MIVKESKRSAGSSASDRAGHQQENEVAFYLRREFGDETDVFVYHDLTLAHGGETAQIDHLILHRYGFVIVESKSIRGEVTVNRQGEWSRSYRKQWSGMKSPLRQAELQQDILKAVLRDNVERLLGKLIGMQKGFGGRDWQIRCAVSSDAILHRDQMPDEISDAVVKAEVIGRVIRPLANASLKERLMADRVWFSKDELAAIRDFLLEADTRSERVDDAAPQAEDAAPEPDNGQLGAVDTAIAEPSPAPLEPVDGPDSVPTDGALACKKCGTQDRLEAKYGRYGYYVVCPSCAVNTSMKRPCSQCASRNTWVQKSGPNYTLGCQDCAYEVRVFTAAA